MYPSAQSIPDDSGPLSSFINKYSYIIYYRIITKEGRHEGGRQAGRQAGKEAGRQGGREGRKKIVVETIYCNHHLREGLGWEGGRLLKRDDFIVRLALYGSCIPLSLMLALLRVFIKNMISFADEVIFLVFIMYTHDLHNILLF